MANSGDNISLREIRSLKRPKSDSHKGENGELLIIAGNERYHGAVLLAAQVASKIVDLIFVSSTELNNELIKNLKSRMAEFITLDRREVKDGIKEVDAVLLGPGLGATEDTEKMVNDILSNNEQKKFVLDADVLKVLDPDLLHGGCVLTPHKREFEQLFGLPSTQDNLIEISRRYGDCVIVLKGEVDHVVRAGEIKKNTTGNAGMTKGGTGDVLAGLIAALATQNDIYSAACAGVFLNGYAGDTLADRVSYYYNAGDLVEQIPLSLKELLQSQDD
jgi:NAD(P)H-hydrate epimerase